MANHTPLAHLVSQVERLLLRHEELRRTNELLSAQVAELTTERDLLRSKHAAARARIDALLDRLPPPHTSASNGSP
jgi:uncharacterized protein (TIGR02449 family)